jgi:sulfite exporter TauE/SafE
MTPLDFWLGFSLGLIGSMHCVQMCGPIVLAYSLPLGQSPRLRPLPAHLSYNTGRIVTYSALGALAGALGGGVGALGGSTGALRGIAGAFNTAALVAGVLMLIAGVLMSGLLPLPASLVRLTTRPSGLWTRSVGRFLRSSTPGSKLAMGLLLGFMPCGLIYAALLKAVETGSAAGGAVTMLAFGLGTTGALLAMGVFSTTVSRWLGRAAGWLPAVAVILMGAFLVWRGVKGVGPALGHSH